MVPAQSRSSLGSNASTAPDLDLSDEEVDEDDDDLFESPWVTWH